MIKTSKGRLDPGQYIIMIRTTCFVIHSTMQTIIEIENKILKLTLSRKLFR